MEVFYVVAQRLSITAGAVEMRLTQPAISLQIRALEKEFGLLLFERGGTRLRLTQAGEAFYPCVASILQTRDEAKRLLSDLGSAKKGKLVLGANTTGGMYLLPRIIAAFRQKLPDTEIVLQIDTTERLYEATLQNGLDMALVGGPTTDKRFGVEALCLDRVALIVSPSHSFARTGVIALKDLERTPCILPQLGSRTRQLVERTLRVAGITLNVVMQLPGTEAVKKAVEANLGIAFVSSYAIEREVAMKALHVIRIDNFEIPRQMELIYRHQKYFSPVAQQFRDFACRFAETIAPAVAIERPRQRRNPGGKAKTRHRGKT
ncbi:MAG: LysR family transcriptional regulator [Acidobacteria bacterium]|nr:LysR family transcriptional regulator [Acidobacteriota bacterium]